MQSKYNPKSRHNDLVIQELPDEVLIYDLKTNKAFCLNHTAAFVWQHADGSTPITQIAYLLQKKLRTPVDESVVWFALEQLGKDGLLENKVAAPLMFAGMNRRDLIKTLGKSAAVALPLVMMITVPMPADAGSTCGSAGQQCGSQFSLPCCEGLTCGNNSTCQTTGGGGGGCVLWDTEITTADGSSIRARDVVDGQSLLGVNCMNGETVAGRVKHVMEKETNGVYSIFAENGAVVNCSPSHTLIEGFGDRDGKRAELFKEGDALLIYDRASRKIVEAKTTAINRVEIYQPVLMFEMDTAEHTFVSGEIVSHNKGLR
ncbi:MAG: PqqD family peptide modification chaperone [Aridibacter sp.]